MSIDDVLAALDDALTHRTGGDAGMSSQELAERAGVSTNTIMRRLRVGVRSGAITVGWAMRDDIVGAARRVPVYRRADEAKAKKTSTTKKAGARKSSVR